MRILDSLISARAVLEAFFHAGGLEPVRQTRLRDPEIGCNITQGENRVHGSGRPGSRPRTTLGDRQVAGQTSYLRHLTAPHVRFHQTMQQPDETLSSTHLRPWGGQPEGGKRFTSQPEQRATGTTRLGRKEPAPHIEADHSQRENRPNPGLTPPVISTAGSPSLITMFIRCGHPPSTIATVLVQTTQQSQLISGWSLSRSDPQQQHPRFSARPTRPNRALISRFHDRLSADGSPHLLRCRYQT